MKHKLGVKIMVWILAILMIGSAAGVLISVIFTPSEASAAEVVVEAEEVVEDTEYVTVGLMYGSDVTVGFETITTVGFNVHAVTSTKTERFSEEIFSIELPKVSVVCDDNLSQTAYTYSIFNGSKTCVVGGYHIEVKEGFATREEAEAMLEIIKEKLIAEESDMHPFIAYINGEYKIRIGDYGSTGRIEEKIATVPLLAEEIELVTVVPSATAVSVVDPLTNVIYFEFDDGGNRWLGLSAMPKDEKTQYLKTPANRLYDGIFLYERYKTSSTDGVALANMLPLDDYIAGVVPYEISPRWPTEALRAFSICVRSYTIQNKNRHYTSYGFDTCNTTHCQVYRGIGDATDAVFDAVRGTSGLVLCYGDTIVPAYYSSSTGGYTASAKDTWGGSDTPYLQPVYTPWERYSEYGNGLWVSKVSGKDLANYLRNKGYTKITGETIVDVKINSFSGDGTYVYSISYTDSDSNVLTIERCDKVRTSLSQYLYSANFTVGKGTLTYYYDEVVDTDVNGGVSVTTGDYVKAPEESVSVLTADGVVSVDSSKVYVKTENEGNKTVNRKDVLIATADSCYYYDLFATPAVTLRRVTKTEEAEDNVFIFAGKGWGHGVGLSQYGIRDLALAGAIAEDILLLYCPTLEIKDYREIKK